MIIYRLQPVLSGKTTLINVNVPVNQSLGQEEKYSEDHNKFQLVWDADLVCVVLDRGCLVTWLPYSYVLGNLSVLAVGVWAIAQRDSIDAVLMFLMGLAVTILTDIVHIGVYYTQSEGLYERNGRDTFRFSAGMAILSLLLKPISCFFVYQMYHERGGDYNVNFGFLTVTRNTDTYQSIDQQSGGATNSFGQTEDGKHGACS